MRIRNPINKGRLQVVAVSLIGEQPTPYKVCYKVDHPFNGEPQHFIQINGPRLLPPHIGQWLQELDHTMFVWLDRHGVEYTLDCEHLNNCTQQFQRTFTTIIDHLTKELTDVQ